MKKLAVLSLQLAVLCLILVCGSAWGDQMPEEVVGADEDDGHETDVAGCVVILTYVDMRYTNSDSLGFFRFTTIPIVKDATIDACTLFLDVINTTADDPDIDIFGEDVASATALVSENECISSRTQTTASVEWIGTGIGAGYKASPELKTIVQEIVNRGDWSSGNDLAFICVVNPASVFVVDSYEDPGSPAKLHIWYTTGAPPEVGQVIIVH